MWLKSLKLTVEGVLCMFAGVYGEYNEPLFLERVAFTLAGHIGVAFY